MRKKRLTQAVRGLDPGSRALLDLSLRRRIPDDEIGDFLGIDAAGVARRRAAALRRLGTELEIQRPEELTRMLAALAALPADAWGVPARPGDTEPAMAGARTVPVSGGRRPARAVVIAGVPLTALGVLVALIIAAGGDETMTETGRIAAGERPAPPVLGEVPTPLEDGDKGGGESSRADRGDGERGDSGSAPAGEVAGLPAGAPTGGDDTSPAPEPDGDNRVRGRGEEGGPEEPDGDRPEARIPEPSPEPAPTPAPAPEPAPAPAPGPLPGGGGDKEGSDNPGPPVPARPEKPAGTPQPPEPPAPPVPPKDVEDRDEDRVPAQSPSPPARREGNEHKPLKKKLEKLWKRSPAGKPEEGKPDGSDEKPKWKSFGRKGRDGDDGD
jgi:hypothetical protein